MTMLDPDIPAQQMRLHMGEMTAQEMRTARAAIRWANSALSTVTPAEVGGLVGAQTEARAIARASLWVPAKPEHAKIGWTYDFEQTERISRAAYDSTGYEATMEVVEFVMAEADRRHATALAAKDAELAKEREKFQHFQDLAAAHRTELEAALAEARKALESIESKARGLAEDSYTSNRGLWLACADEAAVARRALTGGQEDA